ncbi:MAG: class I SAM-dependent methyltransferase, partial [Candidatus Muirbacterium halophilum]|nr:class I SAM-dependent methyltransferase [Candidatus Muirbacterium halophilum]
MNCRVCGYKNIKEGYFFRCYQDYSVNIYRCPECNSLFSDYDRNIYIKLHNMKDSTYKNHVILAQSISVHFKNCDFDRIYNELGKSYKNRFVMDEIEKLDNRELKILEIGCSDGYLTSFFIAKGYNILGIDVSQDCIDNAKHFFGKKFFKKTEELDNNEKFDVIYHVGTIGCVDNPKEFIEYYADKLNSGGIMFFNAPNVSALYGKWINGTLPPDLTILFDPVKLRCWIDKKYKLKIVVLKKDLKKSLNYLFFNKNKRKFLLKKNKKKKMEYCLII